jgi:hypothetical protein
MRYPEKRRRITIDDGTANPSHCPKGTIRVSRFIYFTARTFWGDAIRARSHFVRDFRKEDEGVRPHFPQCLRRHRFLLEVQRDFLGIELNLIPNSIL